MVPTSGTKIKPRIITREDAIATLRAHEGELRERGIVRLSLVGSTARGQARPGSDVDLVAEFDKAGMMTLLDLVRLEQRIADLLGVDVDLMDVDMLPPRVRAQVEAEAVLAF